jgi:SnoaL-like domain
MDNSELERRITRLEDIEAIKQLKALYCEICDDDHNPERITKIFAEDGTWEGGDFGKGQGHEGIRELFRGFAQMISFSQHNIMNPRIEIDGNRARVCGTSWGPSPFGKTTALAGSPSVTRTTTSRSTASGSTSTCAPSYDSLRPMNSDGRSRFSAGKAPQSSLRVADNGTL